MGVRGLARYCYHNESRTSRVVESLHDVTLAVDFAGFHFYVCEEIAKHIEDQSALPAAMWLLLGGCPIRLEQFVDAWLRRLAAARVTLLVVADPPQCFLGANHSKTIELQDRAQQKIAKLRTLRDGLFSTPPPLPPPVSVSSTPRRTPPEHQQLELNADKKDAMATLLHDAQRCFPFSREKLRSVLKRHGVRIVTAMREADDELAQLVRDGKAFAVLSNDSDFLVMQGVQYIPFHKLKVDDRRVGARMFSSALVAQALEVAPPQLVDLALLCTNDFSHELDGTYHFAQTMGFPRPSTIRSGGDVVSPELAAMYIKSQLSPLLDDARLQQVARLHGAAFTDKLGAIYHFYGFGSEFTTRFPYTPPPRVVADADMLKYKKLLDHQDYSTSIIDVMHGHTRRMKQQFDLLAARQPGSSMLELLAPARSLLYSAMRITVVAESSYDPATGRHTQRDVRQPTLPFLEAFFEGKRSQLAVEQAWRGMVFHTVFGNENGLENASFLWKLIGKDSPSYKSVIASLAVVWKCDTTHLPATNRLVTMETLEIFLLTAVVCTALKDGRQPAMYDFEATDLAIDWQVYASVGAFIETLRVMHFLRVVLGERRVPTTNEPMCPSLFSAEVFMPVYAIVKSTKDPNSAATPTNPLAGHALSRAQVDSVLCYYVSDLHDDARTKQWDLFCRLRAVLNRFVELSHGALQPLSVSGTHPINGSSLRFVPTPPPPPPPSFVPPLPVYTPAPVPPLPPPVPRTNRSTPKAATPKNKKSSAKTNPGKTVRGSQIAPPLNVHSAPFSPDTALVPPAPPAQTQAPPVVRTTPGTSSTTGPTTQRKPPAPLLTPAAVTKRLGKTQPGRKPTPSPRTGSRNNNNQRQPPRQPSTNNTYTLPRPTPVASGTNALEGLLERLPVFKHRDEILKNVLLNQLTIIQGETGCGKSTSVPQFLLDDWLENRGPNASDRPVNIYVTQPRRIAAMELAKTVAKMRKGNAFDEDGKLGDVIGYRIGQKHEASASTKITYVTTGYMVEKLIHDHDTLQDLTHLVIDEVHERSMDVDSLLLLLKLQLPKHPHLRILIMSATMDARVLIKYFSKVANMKLINRKPLFVGTKLFPVENVFIEDVAHVYPHIAHAKHSDFMRIHTELEKVTSKRAAANSDIAQNVSGSVHDAQLRIIPAFVQQLMLEHHQYSAVVVPQCILIFLPGIGSINKIYEALTEHFNASYRGIAVTVTVLHSTLEMDQQQAAFDTIQGKATKIVLATNLAESSVTIPDVTHVINCGMEKQIQMPNAESTHAEVLVDVWCSRASVQQRSGRAGRLMAGVAFHLFSREFYLSCMAEFTTPEILRKPLDRIVLQLKGKFHEFGVPSNLLTQALDAPDLSHIDGAYNRLAQFDAIDSADEDAAQITPFGSFVCHMPLTMELCRLMLVGTSVVSSSQATTRPYLLAHLLVLVAVLSSPSLFIQPSWFHHQSPTRYMAEMKLNLRAKLDVDNGCWSEPLAVWKLYMSLMAEHTLTRRPNVLAMVRNRSISTKRWQSLNLLIADTCERFISLANHGSVDLDAPSIAMLRRLEAFASGQRVDSELLAFAKSAVNDELREMEILRFLAIHNYSDQMLVARLQEGSHYDDDDDAVIESTDRVDLTIGAEDSKVFFAMPTAERKKMLAHLAHKESDFTNIAFAKTELSLYAKAVDTSAASAPVHQCFDTIVPRLSFPISLAYYICDQKFPVDLGYTHSDGTEKRIRLRVGDTSGITVAWVQAKDSVRVNIGGRSLFALPVRCPPTLSLAAVYVDRLYIGTEKKMYCHKLTLLPPHVVTYQAVMLLTTVRKHANVWLQVDRQHDEMIVAIKIDRQIVAMPPRKALHRDALVLINKLREGLSATLQCLPATDPTRTFVAVESILDLSGDDGILVRMTKEEARDRQYDWQQLTLETPTTTQRAALRASGRTEPRFPPFLLP